MRKIQLIITVAEHMVDDDIFEEDVLNDLATDSPGLSPVQVELKKAKIETKKVVEIEKARIETEVEKARTEQETRLREIEDRRTPRNERRNDFDLT